MFTILVFKRLVEPVMKKCQYYFHYIRNIISNANDNRDITNFFLTLTITLITMHYV